MTITYHPEHLARFLEIPPEPQGPLFQAPQVWVRRHQIADVPAMTRLPATPLDRHQVRAICRDMATPALHAYVCAMAWGGQGNGPGASRHVQNAWAQRERIAETLAILRKGGLSRAEAYELMAGSNAIPGLGPSYLTKLLFFFSPEPTLYIMDQWTAKSVNLLTSKPVVRVYGDAPSALNTGRNYTAFCEIVDDLAHRSGQSGEATEQRLFSRGGKKRAAWREYVHALWKEKAPGTANA